MAHSLPFRLGKRFVMGVLALLFASGMIISILLALSPYVDIPHLSAPSMLDAFHPLIITIGSFGSCLLSSLLMGLCFDIAMAPPADNQKSPATQDS